MDNLTLTNYYEEEFTTLIKKHFDKFHFRFKDIEEMFAEEGEAAFRDREAAVLQELCESTGRVIATGGGVVLRQSNRERLQTAHAMPSRARLRASLSDACAGIR